MSTLSDVYEFYRDIELACELFGWEPEFKDKFFSKFRKLGATIRFEEGFSAEEILAPPKDMVLGSQAEAKFQNLKNWVYSLPIFETIPITES